MALIELYCNIFAYKKYINMQNIQTLPDSLIALINSAILNMVQSKIPSYTGPSPLILTHSSQTDQPDESSQATLIYQENEHFIEAYNLHQSEDSDSNDAYDALLEISQALPDTLLTAVNNLSKEHFQYAPLSFIPTNNGLIHLAINQYHDSLFIQITDHCTYITFTQSGQY